MGRRRLAWAVSFALSAIGWLIAHSVAYRLAAPDADERVRLLATSGHGYLAYAPFVLAFCLIMVAVLLAAYAVRGTGTRRRPTTPLALFGALPPLAFVVQEHLERLAHGGDLAFAVTEPVFLLGLVLQVPFALAALVIARALLAFADAVVGRLGTWTPRRLATAPAFELVPWVDRPPIAALALGHGQRAPPLLRLN